MRNFTGRRPGVDLRADGGFVVVPPSRHATGVDYTWVIGPEEGPLAPPPPWLFALCDEEPDLQEDADVTEPDWAKLHGGAPLGQRHSDACRIAGHYLAAGLPAAEVEARLLEYAARCTPPHDPEDVRRIVRDLARSDTSKKRRAAENSERLLNIANEAELFHGPDGETAFATITIDGHHETWPVRSRGYKDCWLRRFYDATGKAPSETTFSAVRAVVEARARFDGPAQEVFIRVGRTGAAFYLDLGNERWEAVEITAERWRVVANPPVRFRRTRTMQPLPTPVPGGTLDELKRFVNVDDGDDWRLTRAWLIAALRAHGPFPVIVLHGEQGAAKSTTARVLRMMVDPNSAPLRGTPRDVRDLMISANNAWLQSFDNVSFLEPWLSDALCRLATGGGFSTRQLYTDQDETVFDAQRPILLNGIEELLTRGDLLDRALLLYLPAVPKQRRRAEHVLWADFEEARPRILGALLDCVSGALRELPNIQLPEAPRMADFAIWATAAERALGCPPGEFLEVYAANREVAEDLALEAAPVAHAIQDFADAQIALPWEGTATELLAKLGAHTDDDTRHSRSWPKTPTSLSNALRRLAPALRGVGLGIEMGRHNGGSRARFVRVSFIGGPGSDPGSPASWAPGRNADARWPESINGSGERRTGPYSPCRRCADGTFSLYGDTPLCLPCARGARSAEDRR
jgi:hypothetical protein